MLRFRCPSPSTNGVYNPRGIRRVEKLIPGTITLNARHTPQKTYHPTFGTRLTDSRFNVVSMAKITTAAATIEIHDPLVRPSFPASRIRDGSIPAINPTKRHTDGSGYFSRKNDNILATPRKPTAPPKITGSNLRIWVKKYRSVNSENDAQDTT